MTVVSIGNSFAETTLSGSLIFAMPVAMLAGIVSFASPCVLPLVPGYLSYVTGLSGADLASARRGRMALGAFLFVCGFAVVFVSLGALFGAVGNLLAGYADKITVVLGIVTILLGLAFMGWVPFLRRDVRIHQIPAVGLGVAPLLGVLFGLGWTPCIGPTLGAVNSLALNEATAGRGALLMFVYALGLGLPFIIAAIGFRHALGAFGWIRRHNVWITRLGGAMLVLVGLLLVTGAWDAMIGPMRQWIGGFETAV